MSPHSGMIWVSPLIQLPLDYFLGRYSELSYSDWDIEIFRIEIFRTGGIQYVLLYKPLFSLNDTLWTYKQWKWQCHLWASAESQACSNTCSHLRGGREAFPSPVLKSGKGGSEKWGGFHSCKAGISTRSSDFISRAFHFTIWTPSGGRQAGDPRHAKEAIYKLTFGVGFSVTWDCLCT